jgi:inorganic phosphate transporter, PiT family
LLQGPTDPSQVLEHFVGTREFTPEVVPALAAVARRIAEEVRTFGSLAKVPTDLVKNVRNDMYLASETLRVGRKYEIAPFTGDGAAALSAYEAQLDNATKFIPTWVKVAVALALGLGTMVGWKRIVITVGERIGKTHLSYGQGAAAELVAAGTIGLADLYGLPVSTTHVLSSGVAGTMAANGSGLQMATVRNLLAAWIMPTGVDRAGRRPLLAVQHAVHQRMSTPTPDSSAMGSCGLRSDALLSQNRHN